MPTSEHEAYRARVAAYFRAHADDPDECAWLDAHAQQVAMLWELDLGLAREELQRCFADHPRGGDPWDPVVKLRSLHASALLGEPRVNRWVCNPDDLHQRLQRLYLRVAVQPSAQRGLLGDLTALVVASDGTALVTGARGRGRRVCDCKKTAKCDCPRVYADPDASSSGRLTRGARPSSACSPATTRRSGR